MPLSSRPLSASISSAPTTTPTAPTASPRLDGGRSYLERVPRRHPLGGTGSCRCRLRLRHLPDGRPPSAGTPAGSSSTSPPASEATRGGAPNDGPGSSCRQRQQNLKRSTAARRRPIPTLPAPPDDRSIPSVAHPRKQAPTRARKSHGEKGSRSRSGAFMPVPNSPDVPRRLGRRR